MPFAVARNEPGKCPQLAGLCLSPRPGPGRTRTGLRASLSRGHTEGVAALPRFVVQLHDATTLHFDFRLQSGQVLRSWAVPKGPSLDPGIRRLAVPVEDHALTAGEFEGVYDGQQRGSGAVIIWDEGTAEIVREEPGHISFVLHGRKLSGGFALTRTGEQRWILVKVKGRPLNIYQRGKGMADRADSERYMNMARRVVHRGVHSRGAPRAGVS